MPNDWAAAWLLCTRAATTKLARHASNWFKSNGRSLLILVRPWRLTKGLLGREDTVMHCPEVPLFPCTVSRNCCIDSQGV